MEENPRAGLDCNIFRKDASHSLMDTRMVTNSDNDPQFTIGGLENYANHVADAYISEVRTYDRLLTAAEVDARYRSTCARYSACYTPEVGTAATCTVTDTSVVFGENLLLSRLSSLSLSLSLRV